MANRRDRNTGSRIDYEIHASNSTLSEYGSGNSPLNE